MRRKTAAKLTPELVAARERRAKLEEMILRGVTSKDQMAAALGVTRQTVWRDERWVMENWHRQDVATARRKQALRVKQLESVYRKAMLSYERSTLDAERTTTRMTPRRCASCRGTGFVEGTLDWCRSCDGEGLTVNSDVTRETRGQSGNASHLRVALDCIRQIALIEGLYPRGDVTVNKLTVNQQNNVQNVDLSSAPTDLVLEARRVCLQLSSSLARKNGSGGAEEGDVDGGPAPPVRQD